MTNRTDNSEDRAGIVTTPDRIELPPLEAPTPEEIERRRALFARVIARREKIGPIGIRTDELVRQVREEADGIKW